MFTLIPSDSQNGEEVLQFFLVRDRTEQILLIWVEF
jgi:hypothetical protein